jgi:biopolymer transport protein ExbD
MLPKIDDIEIERIHGSNEATRKAEKRSIDVDMNPMVDLAFLLLTFFMLATTFSKPQVMELLVPAKPKADDVQQETPVKESRTLSLVIHEDKLVYYRGITDPEPSEMAFKDADILALLLSAKDDTEGLVVLVKPLQEARFENIVQVLDALRFADVQRYALDEPSAFDTSNGQDAP